LTDAALAEPASLGRFEHLGEIVLHFWQDGRILRIYPDIAAGPIVYPGQYSAAYFSATVKPTEQPSTSFQYLVVHPPDSDQSSPHVPSGESPS
jgi:hypothetical protein